MLKILQTCAIQRLAYVTSVCLIGLLTGCTGDVETSSSFSNSSSLSNTSSLSNSSASNNSAIPPSSQVPVSSANQSSISSQASSSPLPPLGDGCPTSLSSEQCVSFERGKADYIDLGCQSCHGDEGQGQGSFPPVKDHQCTDKVAGGCGDVGGLAQYISASMPVLSGSPEDCIDSNTSSCASDIATYMVTQFAPQATAGDSDADGIADSADACPNTALENLKSIDHRGCAATNAGSASELIKAVNAGGEAAAYDNINFEADQNFSGGTDGGSATDELFTSERYGANGSTFSYELDVTNGTYYATLYFSEAAKDAAGERVFDVNAEGSTVLANVDPYSLAGAKSAPAEQTTPNFSVTDGKATLEFVARTFNPQLSGLALYKTGNNDGDNDGVTDAQEGKECPGTQPGAAVDSQGCSIAQLDKDNDGIPLPEDLCPSSLTNESVSSSGNLYPGCSDREISIDGDGDSIPDFADNCPDTPLNINVGATGCEGNFGLGVGAIVSPQMRLTVNEYINTVKAAFETDTLPNATHLSDSSGPFGLYRNNASDQTADFLTAIGTAQAYANALAPNYANKCNWNSNALQCLKNHLATPLSKLIRTESLHDDDARELARVIEATLSKGASTEQAVASAIARILIDDRMMYQLELGEDRTLSGKAKLSSPEYASRLSYLLNNVSPDEELVQAYNSIINNNAEIDTQVSRLMSKSAYKDAIWQFFAEWLRIPVERPQNTALIPPPASGDQCNTTSECRTDYAGLAQSYDCKDSNSNMSWCECDGVRCDSLSSNASNSELSLEASMYEETRRFVEYVIDNNLPFIELITANYSFINKTLADHYGVSAPASDWERYTFPDSAQRKGILTHASVLSATGGHGRNKNTIFRGKILFEGFFCEIMPPAPPNVVDQPIEDRSTHPSCRGCHAVVDPIGRIYDAYDDEGKLFGNVEQFGEIKLDIDIAGSYDSAVVLANVLGNSKTLTHCVTRQLFRFALGRDINEQERADFLEVRDEVDGGSSINDIVKTIVKSDIFKHVYSKPAPQACAVGS